MAIDWRQSLLPATIAATSPLVEASPWRETAGSIVNQNCRSQPGVAQLRVPPGDYLKRSEEGVDVGFISVRQAVEHGGYISRLPSVPRDCVIVGKREAVMHQTVACPQSPEWRGPYLVRGLGVFRQGHDRDAVSGTNIVQQEVAIRIDNFVAERVGTVKAPPLIAVPAVAVVMEAT